MLFDTSILTVLLFLPLAGAAIILVQPKGNDNLHRWTALAFSVIVFVLSVPLFVLFVPGEEGMQFEVRGVQWLGALGAHYHVGVDGLSILLVLLTTFLTAISILASWRAIKTNVKAYMACFLMLETGMIGAFVSLDYILFYVFWEAMLIPMYFIIGVWGGPNRVYAAVKFFLYTMFGSVLMLVGILFIYYHPWAPYAAERSFDVLDSIQLIRNHPIPINPMQLLLFGAFAVAFAIKVPMFPFHTWLPDAHVEAPTAGSVILAGVLLKMGTYGFVRFCLPLFPDACELLMPLVAVLAIVGIVYGALVCIVQPDMKKLVAYSSVSHLGFVVLGIFAFNEQGIQGATIQMVNHGLSTGALFLLVGMLYERRHTRMISDFGGLWKRMPIFATFFIIILLASIGLPGLNGFVGEFLVLAGAFRASPWLAAAAATGVIFAAVYMLWMFQRVMQGPLDKEENKKLKDLSVREIVILVPIVLMCFWIGLYPKPFFERTRASLMYTLQSTGHDLPPTPTPEAGERPRGPMVLSPEPQPSAPRAVAAAAFRPAVDGGCLRSSAQRTTAGVSMPSRWVAAGFRPAVDGGRLRPSAQRTTAGVSTPPPIQKPATTTAARPRVAGTTERPDGDGGVIGDG